MFEMSYNEALKIQKAQLVWYRQLIGRDGVKKIMGQTKPCDFNPDTPVSIFAINDLVPRGGSIESIIKRFPKESDESRAAWHSAIRNGKIYH